MKMDVDEKEMLKEMLWNLMAPKVLVALQEYHAALMRGYNIEPREKEDSENTEPKATDGEEGEVKNMGSE